MTALAAALFVIALGAWWRPRLTMARGGDFPRRRRWRARRRTPPTAEAWAAVLDRMSAEVRTGSSLPAAYAVALRAAAQEGAVVRECVALADLAGGSPADPDEAVVAQAITSAHALGGPVAATLDAASSLLRERAAIRAEALAYSAQARLSARVLTGVPVAFAGWSTLASRSFRGALLSPLGLVSASLGGVANVLGWWWMRRLVTKAAQ